MKNTLLVLVLLFVGQTILQAQYLPPQREGVSEANYKKWTHRIQYWDKTMKDKELSDKGKVIFYANYATAYYMLKEPVDSVYNKLEKAILVSKYEGCNFLDFANKNGTTKLPKIENQVGADRWYQLMNGCDVEIEKKRKSLAEQRLAEFKANKHLYNFALIEELKGLAKNDQELRLEALRIEVQVGQDSEQYRDIKRKVLIQDSLNLIEVEKIIKTHGYPGKSLVSTDFNEVVLWVIHHAESNEIQDKYLSILYEAAVKKELNVEAFKLFLDTIHLNKFGTQLYGTQSQYNKKTRSYEPSPIEQPEKFEERFANLEAGVIDLGRLEVQ